jgi:hypothetical protein
LAGSNGSSQLVLVRVRPLTRGRYTLILSSRHDGCSITRHEQISMA